MSFLKNTLNFASYNYNASTNTPTLAGMKDGTVFEVATAGKVVGILIEGASVGADSYLLVGDKVVRKNGTYELLTREVKDNTNITIGTGGLFSNFYTANEYIKQRIYSTVRLTMLSATVETQSVEVNNPCGGTLKIYGSGLTIDFSGTVNTNCILSGDNIHIDNFVVKANTIFSAVYIPNSGYINYTTSITSNNINMTSSAMDILIQGGSLQALYTGVDASINCIGAAGLGKIGFDSNGGNVVAFGSSINSINKLIAANGAKISVKNLTVTGANAFIVVDRNSGIQVESVTSSTYILADNGNIMATNIITTTGLDSIESKVYSSVIDCGNGTRNNSVTSMIISSSWLGVTAGCRRNNLNASPINGSITN